MATKSGGLGRGLGELFTRTEPPAEPIEHDESVRAHKDKADAGQTSGAQSQPMPDGSYFQDISVSKIKTNPKQPRQVFDEDELAELADSIKEVGLLQPIVVREAGKGYELIMGERRLRAHQLAGLKKIPAIVRGTHDEDLLRDALLENLHRVQLNPLEEAAAYQQLMDDFGCSQEELAKRIKRSRPHIANTIRLLRLPPSVQRRVAAGVLSAGHARALLALSDVDSMEQLAQRIVSEGLSVRATEEAVTLWETPTQTIPSRRSVATPDPVAIAVADRLGDRLDTRVKVKMGARKGHVTIEFADADDLQRIMGLLIAD